MYPGLEHINLDWYPPILLISGYSEVTGVAELAEKILAADMLGQIEGVIHQSRSSQGATANVLWGEAKDAFVVTEQGVLYEVQP
ncbi:MAG: 23S rRNA (cytosine1962-C5)-methyltransferase, partial [Candidatus Azotimanducaceae bacterium]